MRWAHFIGHANYRNGRVEVENFVQCLRTPQRNSKKNTIPKSKHFHFGELHSNNHPKTTRSQVIVNNE